MKNIHIFCEGDSEELFVQQVLQEYLGVNYNVTYQKIKTGRHKGTNYKGGVTTYERFKHELTRICKEKSAFTVSTLFDYYAFPKDAPKMESQNIDKYEKIADIENAIAADLGNPENLIVNLVLHEFETLLFSSPESFEQVSNKAVADELVKIKQKEHNPEFINEGHDSAPSKRIERVFEDNSLFYRKKIDGLQLIKQIGIENIMRECKHFREWVERIKG